jgi:NAD(P)-dependent dehydrogenase (short-subunit alcohol dehydrogenase family)
MVKARYGEEGMAHMVNQTLVKRISKPEDAAEAYLYCMKDPYITGKQIATDGGRLLV